GNPLYVLELLDGLNAEGELSVVDGLAHSATIGMPPSLRLTLVRRISYLSDDALAAARIAAVLHAGFTVVDASLLLGRPVPELIGPFDEMRRAQLIVEVDGLLRFRHELIREAIYEDLPISARAALHQKAGLALAASGAPAVRVAAHFGRGATTGDANAVAWLRRAAREEQARSPEGAVSLLVRAVEIDGAGGSAADELSGELASALVWSGRVADGRVLARELSEAGSPDVRRDARLTLLRAAWLEGRWSELIDLTTQFAADPSTDARGRARLIAERAFAKVFVGDPEGTAEHDALAALAYGEAHGDDVITFLGLYGLAPVLDFQARYADALAVAQQAVEIAERTKAEEILRLHPHFALAMALRSVERYDVAAETFRVGLAVRERLGTVWDQPLYHAGLALLAFETGRWDDAAVEAETALSSAAEVGTVMGTTAAGSLLALVMLHRDSVDEAAAYLDRVRETIASSGPQWGMFWVYLARARLAEARGEPAEALSVLRECWDVHAAFPGVRMWGAVDLVRTCLTLGESALAADVALTVEAIASAAGTATASGAAHLCRGLVDDDVTELVGAVEAYRAGGRVHDLAVACERAGAALADHGQRDDARALMQEAVAVYERLGAQRDQRRAAAVMRQLGFRRGSRTPHTRAATGWDALTATERQVASLAAAGLTNPEIGARLFISRRTVQTHLSHVFAKLAVRSRVELASLAASRS
ncbi:MAG: hypothetical protein QOH74_745, partial [Gaiellales bacterium]|nr:hypothetical protein [Gaiellales bacterium]